jgi:hypothetical protein
LGKYLKKYNSDDKVIKDKKMIVVLLLITKSLKNIINYSKKSKFIKKVHTTNLTMVNPFVKNKKCSNIKKEINKTFIISKI